MHVVRAENARDCLSQGRSDGTKLRDATRVKDATWGSAGHTSARGPVFCLSSPVRRCEPVAPALTTLTTTLCESSIISGCFSVFARRAAAAHTQGYQTPHLACVHQPRALLPAVLLARQNPGAPHGPHPWSLTGAALSPRPSQDVPSVLLVPSTAHRPSSLIHSDALSFL